MDHRCRITDWRLDTIIGKGHSGVLVSPAERKPRLTLLAKAPGKTAKAARKAYAKIRGVSIVLTGAVPKIVIDQPVC